MVRRVAAAALQLLEEMHGESVVIATSNHPDLLDTAVWRRFDDIVPFAPLDVDQIGDLIELKLRAVPHQITVREWAARLRDSSPAEVELMCMDVLRRVALEGASAVTDKLMAAAVVRLETRRSVVTRLGARLQAKPRPSAD